MAQTVVTTGGMYVPVSAGFNPMVMHISEDHGSFQPVGQDWVYDGTGGPGNGMFGGGMQEGF
jgi:hypothetical protein